MAVQFLTRWWWVVLLAFIPAPHFTECRNVTHEDIRDVMMSLVHLFRTSEDKLERHEYREKALGDQIKKMLIGLEKKHRSVEGMISRLDERLSNVETILLQKEEREKVTQQKTNNALDSINKSLQGLSGGGVSDTPPRGDRLQQIETKVDRVKADIEELKKSWSAEGVQALCLTAGSNANPLEKHISEAEKLLNKYELKLSEYNGNSSRVQTDFVPLSEVLPADEAWHSKMTDVMERQEKEIKKIQHLLSDAEGMWKDLPRLADLHRATNHTISAIGHAQQNIQITEESTLNKMVQKLGEMSNKLVATNEDIQKSLTEGNTMSERAYNDINRSYDTLRTEVQTLSKNEHVLVQTADNVIATKKRIEYGVHQILMEVGELVKAQTSNMNNTINQRFDSIETTIVENQTGALTNLSSKIESEMSQVWRQIGIMYQQLTASKVSLDKLTEQTEQYVNGSENTMKNMKDKVTLITARMGEVDENLNYLLGRLSLVMQEFNQVKTGLGDTLDKVKSSFVSVQAQIEDTGPGPHKISSAEKET